MPNLPIFLSKGPRTKFSGRFSLKAYIVMVFPGEAEISSLLWVHFEYQILRSQQKKNCLVIKMNASKKNTCGVHNKYAHVRSAYN